jgi:anti-anti-sigma regulatory factor
MLFKHSSESSSSATREDAPQDGPQDAFKVLIKNMSGVPVLEVFGEINRTTVRMIERTAFELAKAGHYHLVLNIENAAVANARALAPLSRLLREVKRHYGGVILVTRLEQVGQRISRELQGLLQLCASEAEALLRIKRLPVVACWDTRSTTARLAD